MPKNNVCILFIVSMFFLSSCSKGADLKQTTLTKNNLVSIQKQINSSTVLTTDEQQWYMLGQIQISSKGGQVVGKTVDEVIAAGKSVAPKK